MKREKEISNASSKRTSNASWRQWRTLTQMYKKKQQKQKRISKTADNKTEMPPRKMSNTHEWKTRIERQTKFEWNLADLYI